MSVFFLSFATEEDKNKRRKRQEGERREWDDREVA